MSDVDVAGFEVPGDLQQWQRDGLEAAREMWGDDERTDVPRRGGPATRWVRGGGSGGDSGGDASKAAAATAGGPGGAGGDDGVATTRVRPVNAGSSRTGLGAGSGEFVHSSSAKIGVDPMCGVIIQRGSWAGRACDKLAGQGTAHVGAGPCIAHGGAKRRGRATGAWLMAHAFGAELNITPWEGLLRAVRIAAGKVAYCEWVLGQAQSDLELEGRVIRTGEGEEALLVHPDTGVPLGVGEFRDLSFWVAKSELWHDRLARTSKMAVDAGVAVWQVEKAQADANAIARVLNAVMEGLEGDMSEAQVTKMRQIMRHELMTLDAETSTRQLEGSGDADGAVVDSTYREENW